MRTFLTILFVQGVLHLLKHAILIVVGQNLVHENNVFAPILHFAEFLLLVELACWWLSMVCMFYETLIQKYIKPSTPPE